MSTRVRRIAWTAAILMIWVGWVQASRAEALKTKITVPRSSALTATNTNMDAAASPLRVAQSEPIPLDELDTGDEGAGEIADPLYYWNRAMYHVNDKLYFWVLKPLAQGYKVITPSVVRRGVSNFFQNLGFPARFVGSLLQGKFRRAGLETQRFLLNTTVGIAGFLNPAENRLSPAPPEEDVGQALAVWGVGDGFYIVWPFFGPSNIRDTVGLVADYFLDPVTYVALADGEGLFDGPARYYASGIKLYRNINETSFRIGDYEALKNAALDPYTAIRDAYTQRRRQQIRE